MADTPVYYWDYLKLGSLLDAQDLVSARHGAPAHDEMLFIITHQAFELWFKQILWELDAVLEVMGGDVVPEKEMDRVVSRLRRITGIQRLLIEQIDVLETMTPLDFLEFRDLLSPASGFQSVQFRLIENKLGLDPQRRLKIKGAAYTEVIRSEHAAVILATENEPSLFDHVERWLERTPFLSFGQFDFWREYRGTVDRALDADRERVERDPTIGEEERAANLERIDESADTFATLFDRERYEEQRARGRRRLSQEAFLAALLIHLYRDEPLLQLPHRFLQGLVDIDEGFSAWRGRHVLLAHRLIGGRIGTGGTSGVDYLDAAARKHRVFRDFFDLPTYLLPRSALPELPDEVADQMGFRLVGHG